ncbi:uncharacterized protein LOC123941372 isoform X2 [Meles meles]|uniref:uncharacterized protein LOC123941372 isoform X2 n=1 Tax=Meles meles TaxID=9662 RepID=UPI001E69D776|nr:uncharacterized protein LOC123941372 isoform X2 [Meles meles]
MESWMLPIVSTFFKRDSVNGKPESLGRGVVTIERSKSEITVASEVPFSKKPGSHRGPLFLTQSSRAQACCLKAPSTPGFKGELEINNSRASSVDICATFRDPLETLTGDGK